MKQKISLISKSYARKQLLEQAGFEVLVCPGDIDECRGKREEVHDYVKRLAQEKLASQRAMLPAIAADTVVYHQKSILGKAQDRADAKEMLMRFSGNSHQVITGCAIELSQGVVEVFSETSTITFHSLKDHEIEAYLDSGEWQGKAGAYALQALGKSFVHELQGSESNVVGLPMERVLQILAP